MQKMLLGFWFLCFVFFGLSEKVRAEKDPSINDDLFRQTLLQKYQGGPIAPEDLAYLSCPGLNSSFLQYGLGLADPAGNLPSQAYEAVYTCSCSNGGKPVKDFSIRETFCATMGSNPNADLVSKKWQRDQTCKSQLQDHYPNLAVSSCVASEEVRVSFLSDTCQGDGSVEAVFPSAQNPGAAAQLEDLPSPVDRQVTMTFQCKFAAVDNSNQEQTITTDHSISLCHREGHVTSELNGLAETYCQAMKPFLLRQNANLSQVNLAHMAPFPILYFSGAMCVNGVIDVNLKVVGPGNVKGGNFNCNEAGGNCSGQFCRYATQKPGISAVDLPSLTATPLTSEPQFLSYTGEQYRRGYGGNYFFVSAIQNHPTDQTFSSENIFRFSNKKAYEFVLKGEPYARLNALDPLLAIEKPSGTEEASGTAELEKKKRFYFRIAVEGTDTDVAGLSYPGSVSCQSEGSGSGNVKYWNCSALSDDLDDRTVFDVYLTPKPARGHLKLQLVGEGTGTGVIFGVLNGTAQQIQCVKSSAEEVECEIPTTGKLTITPSADSVIDSSESLLPETLSATSVMDGNVLVYFLRGEIGPVEGIIRVHLSRRPDAGYVSVCDPNRSSAGSGDFNSVVSTFLNAVNWMWGDSATDPCAEGGELYPAR